MKRAVETGGGKECVSWKNVENDGERTIFVWDVGIFLQERSKVKRVFESWPTKKSRQEYKVSSCRNRQPEITWSM